MHRGLLETSPNSWAGVYIGKPATSPSLEKLTITKLAHRSAAARSTHEYLVEFPDLVRSYQSALSDRLRYVSSCFGCLAVPEALCFDWTMVQPGLAPTTVPPHPASSVVVVAVIFGYASSMQIS